MKVGIVGANGYTGAELIRLLLNHERATLHTAVSRSAAGKFIYEEHADLFGETEHRFCAGLDGTEELVFLCLPHDESAMYFNEYLRNRPVKVIDLSNAFRYKHEQTGFVYGLTELNREAISDAQYVANPGCFATAIQLALLPLATANMLNSPVHVTALTGSTGAGHKPADTTHFSQRFGNHSVYGAFSHPHLHEINASLRKVQPAFKQEVHFLPARGNFSRGIFASLYTECELDEQDVIEVMQNFYKDSVFVRVSDQKLFLKQVVNTNRCFISVEKNGNQLLLHAIIDNLLKGASGQAMQNMNLMFGFPEAEGLKLKPIAY